MKKLFLVFIVTIIALHVNAQTLNVGENIDNINLNLSTGQRYNLNSQKGIKGFIVVFMTTSCDECLIYMPRILALNDKYAKRGYPVIAISAFSEDPLNYPLDAPPSINKWLAVNKVDIPVLLDEKFKYTNLFGIKNIPEVVLLKKNAGGFQVKYIGVIDNDPNGGNKSVVKFAEQAIKKTLIYEDQVVFDIDNMLFHNCSC